MKPHGSDSIFKQERNSDLMRAYHELVTAKEFVCVSEIYNEVVNMPSRRFWVSEERAAIVISAMMRGNSLKAMRETKREMFEEIYRRAMSVKKAHPQMSMFEIACIVVHQPAPKFYITPGSASVYIINSKKKWYEERKRKLRHLFM